ncbi:hypothetical protein GUITHDRAFT_142603 [Guillardia theta CCMP2712]|uniref:General transcription factor 3C polypeptide 3 n=1 Tax=Guillardia theta (strain CCMP2712) TaxID=905079 RepID=L1IWX7_GUITC|nr:hypothetical protein GUITHDRAFT_142603 [Guillardia theta CCMP2712]EKX40741.1 hypothetical protein GUITHDRAFT_142603 [Guillardia theta CCMP2712]|eukprot:XP_005827721.1 hypothetical protein GUITHDRAFT_142603 [Guillardia theta CCMP2712]
MLGKDRLLALLLGYCWVRGEVEQDSEEEEEDMEEVDEEGDDGAENEEDEDDVLPLQDVDSDDGEGGHLDKNVSLEREFQLGRHLGKRKAGVSFGLSAQPSRRRAGAASKRIVPNQQMDDIADDIWKELAPRKRKRRRKRRGLARGGSRMPQEVKDKLGQATMKYAFGEFEAAIELSKEIIRILPHSDVFALLGSIYEAKNELSSALSCIVIAALLNPKDISLWNRAASMSRDLGNIPQAIYALNRAIKADPAPELLWDKASLLVEVGQTKRAIDVLHTLLKKLPAEEYVKISEVSKELSRLLHQYGDSQAAVKVLESWLDIREKRRMPDDRPRTFMEFELDCVNMLTECFLMLKQSEKALKLLGKVRSYQPNGDMPVDLVVREGIALLQLGRVRMAEECFQTLWAYSIDACGDLYLDVAESYRQAGMTSSEMHHRAQLLEAVRIYKQLTATEIPSLFRQADEDIVHWNQETFYNLGRAFHQLSLYSFAIPCYEQVFEHGAANGCSD